MPKRKAPKGTFWRGPVLWGRIQTEGDDIRWSLRTDDPVVALARRKRERDRQIAVSKFGDERKTFAQALEAWGTQLSRNVGPRTAQRYAVSLGKLEPFLDGLYLDEVDGAVVGEIVDRRIADGISNATIKRDLVALSSVLKFAQARKWRPDNPARDHMALVKERHEPIVLPDPDDIRRVIDAAPGMMAALILAAWHTGCRIGELVNAKHSQIDHARKQLTVIGKRNKLRVIDLHGWGYDGVFKSLPANPGKPWLFWHHDGEPYRTASGQFERLVNRLQAQAQKPAHPGREHPQPFRGFRFHDLRHRHAVDWLKSGRSIYDLQKRLGHTSVKTTEIYCAYLTSEEERLVKFGPSTEGTKSGTVPTVSPKLRNE
jgi:integrase/recombinase XerD